jgi:hypothetical protein
MIASVHGPNVVLLQVFLAIGFGVAVVVSVLRRGREGAGRARDLRALSRRLSFDTFVAIPEDTFASGWGFLDPLNQGADRRAWNLARGTYHDQSLFVFDYQFTTGSGKSREIHYSTILMLICKEAFPRLTIRPETLREKIAATVGIESDIKFESAEFSRKFCVRSPDKKFAYDVCHPRMMEYLLANPRLHLEIQGPALMLSFEPRLPVDQVEASLQRLIAIRSLLPEYLFSQNT